MSTGRCGSGVEPVAERLPYRLPPAESNLQDALVVLLVWLLAASSLVATWFSWKIGQPPGLGEAWLTIPARGPIGAVATLAALVVVGGQVRAGTRGAIVLATLAMLLPFSLALWSGRLYPPWAWIAWRQQLAALDPGLSSATWLRGQLDHAAIAGFALALIPALLLRTSAGSHRGDVHGSARFATAREIRQLNLLARKTGVVVGGRFSGGPFSAGPFSAGRGQYYFAPDRRHVGIFGPSGCGKTSSVVVPTLLSDESSMVVLDIKMELFAMTAQWRREGFGHRVHAFAPTIEASWVSGYNPLADIPKGSGEVAHAQALALALVDPEGRERSLSFWQTSAQSLLTAAILHVLYTESQPSLASLQALLASPASGMRAQLERMRSSLHAPEHESPWIDPATGDETATHPVVRLEASKLLDLVDETLTSILATALSTLTIFLDPVVAENTRRHDFSLRGLGAPGQPVTIYLVLPARDIPRMRGFLRLFFQTLSFHLTGSLATTPDGSGPIQPVVETNRRLTLVLDELAAVGRLDLIARQIAFLRGYGIQVIAAVQTANQLYEVYGERESVRGNLAYLLMFPSTEHKTAEEISKLLGDQTIYVETRGRSSGRTLLAPRRTTTIRDQRRPLLTPDEVRRLPRGTVLLLVTGSQPVLCLLRPYDRIASLRQRAAPGASPRAVAGVRRP